MAAATGDELILRGKSHIGNRASGNIGAKAVDEAALDSLNNGLYSIAKEHSIAALQRFATVAVTTSAYRYAMPVLDTDSAAIRIKDVIRARALRSGDSTDFLLRRISQVRREEFLPTPASTVSGEIIYYTHFGDNLEFYPYPSSAYTVTLSCSVWPTKFTAATLGSSHALGEEWDDVLEYFMAFELFAKLQQTTDALFWKAEYQQKRIDTAQALRKNSDWMTGSRDLPGRGRAWIDVDDPAASARVLPSASDG